MTDTNAPVVSGPMPRVFLSHSKRDGRFIKRLHDDLRRCYVEPWLDTEEIRHGRPWLDAIFRDGIPTCDSVLVYFTPHSLQSQMVKKEIDATLVQQLEDSGVGFLPYVSSANLRKQLRKDIQSLQVPVWNETNYDDLLPRVVAEIWQTFSDRTSRDTVRLDMIVPAFVFPPTMLKHCQWVFREFLKTPDSKQPFRCDAQITRTTGDGAILSHTSPSSLRFNVCEHEGPVLWSDFRTRMTEHPFKAAIRSRRTRGLILWTDHGYTLLERPIKSRDSTRLCLMYFRLIGREFLFLEMHQELGSPLEARVLAMVTRVISERVQSIDWEAQQEGSGDARKRA